MYRVVVSLLSILMLGLAAPNQVTAEERSLYQFRGGDHIRYNNMALNLSAPGTLRFAFFIESLAGGRQSFISDDTGDLYLGVVRNIEINLEQEEVSMPGPCSGGC